MGVALGHKISKNEDTGKDCIDVYISEKTPEIERHIPSVFKSVPVVLQDSGGPIKAHQNGY